MSPRFLTGAALLGALVVLQPYRPYVVAGDSMDPTFSSGQILIGRVRPKHVARGDVIVFRKDNETMVTCRTTEWSSFTWSTNGGLRPTILSTERCGHTNSRGAISLFPKANST
jgi:signal peptidase I